MKQNFKERRPFQVESAKKYQVGLEKSGMGGQIEPNPIETIFRIKSDCRFVSLLFIFSISNSRSHRIASHRIASLWYLMRNL